MLPEANDIIFQSIAFGPTHIEVVYMEQRDLEGEIQEYRTLVIPAEVVQDDIPEVMDALQQLVDHALVVRRSPPERLRGAR